MFPGFGERIEKEISLPVPTMRVNVFSMREGKGAVWIDGSILLSLSTFPLFSIAHEDYNEVGQPIVNLKRF